MQHSNSLLLCQLIHIIRILDFTQDSDNCFGCKSHTQTDSSTSPSFGESLKNNQIRIFIQSSRKEGASEKSLYASSNMTNPSNSRSIFSISERSRSFPVGLLGEHRKMSFVRSSVAARSFSAENWKFSSNKTSGTPHYSHRHRPDTYRKSDR